MLLAVVTQFLTERIAQLYPRYTAYIAAAVGVALTLLAGTGLLESLGFKPANHVADMILAGLLISGGAGLLNSLKEYLRQK